MSSVYPDLYISFPNTRVVHIHSWSLVFPWILFRFFVVRLDVSRLMLHFCGKMKVRITRYHGVAQWHWNIDDNCCGICRMPFEACCPDCTMPGDGCPPGKTTLVCGKWKGLITFCCLVWGKCNHTLHMHCLMKWLESLDAQRQHCPLCRQTWEFKES